MVDDRAALRVGLRRRFVAAWGAVMLGAAVGLVASVPAAGNAHAQSLLPLKPQPCTLRDGRIMVVVVAAGSPSLERISALRSESRRFAERQAHGELHRCIDDRMAERRARAHLAASVHAAVDRRAVVSQTRSLVDGACVLEFSIEAKALDAVGPNTEIEKLW